MEQRYRDGDQAFKPNTRTYTSVIDAWAKSGEKGAARRAEQILNNMIAQFDATGDVDVKPNVHTSNAVCNVSFLDHLLIVCYHVLNYAFLYSRPARFQNTKKIAQRHSRLPFESLIGYLTNLDWSPIHIRTRFFCRFVPTCFPAMTVPLAMLMPAGISRAVAQQDT
jgi:hypothetical protein